MIALHLSGMQAGSPPDAVFALDLSDLQGPKVTVWSARLDGRVAAIGALKRLGNGTAELKSMRTDPAFLRRGLAAALLDHIVQAARRGGIVRLSLETGSNAAFEPAIALYRAYGFVEGKPFGNYAENGFSRFFHLAL